MQLFFFVLPIITVPLTPALADSGPITQAQCGEVNLRSKFGPVRNQSGSGGMCGAFVAADLITEALGMNSQDPVSALHVADTYIASSFAELDALQMGSRSHDSKPLFARLGSPANEFIKLYRAKTRMCLESQLPAAPTNVDDENIHRAYYARYFTRYYELNSSIPGREHDLYPRIQQLPAERHNQAAWRLRTEIDHLCTQAPQLTQLKPEYNEVPNAMNDQGVSRKLSRAEVMALVAQSQQHLNNGRPFAIGYQACYFVNYGSGCRQNILHTSIVVGRRWSANRGCEYLVRNSYGPRWNQCRGSATCTGEGHFWAPAMELMPKVFDTTVVKKN